MMEKLADISAFESLGGCSSQPSAVFNLSYEEATDDIYKDMVSRSNDYWEAWKSLDVKVRSLNTIFNILEEDGVFDDDPKLGRTLRRAIDKYDQEVTHYSLHGDILETWKERCYYGMFWKRMRGENIPRASIDTDLPDYLAHNMRADLADMTDTYKGKFAMGIRQMNKLSKAVDKKTDEYRGYLKGTPMIESDV